LIPRDEWLDLARKLDWEYSYVSEQDLFPKTVSGRPWMEHRAWSAWREPYRTSYSEYVAMQHAKDASVDAVRDAVGRIDDFRSQDPAWISGLKLHAAVLPLAEFAAVVGNLRAARFGRDGAWRSMAALGALDELRHTQIPLLLMHDLVKLSPQFDWTHRFYHTNNWIAIAGRHMFDELLLTADPIELAIGTNFVFETGFTNLQFIGLSAIAGDVGDPMVEKMLGSIQTDEARHAQIGRPVLTRVMEKDPAYAQYLLDKWFWRSWQLFAVVTGITMDYLTPLHARRRSFKEFVEEWVVDQYLASLDELGLARPWYWETFLGSLDTYHHMVYASAYSYRATTWFDLAVPSPAERDWLARRYPDAWGTIAPIWSRIDERWAAAEPGTEWAVHGATPVGFCDLCQLVLCGGTPERNTARVVTHGGSRYVFCSEPCAWIFSREPDRYASHKDIVKRILAGEAPPNMLELLRRYFSMEPETWGRDMRAGEYPWIERNDHD
jgi:toluene monooxygenase system protein A